MIRRLTPAALAALVALVALPTLPHAASGQSTLADRGLGIPLPPLDARSLGWGGVGIGLPGGSLVATDPAAAADVLLPGVNFTFQSSWTSAASGGPAADFSATRFPLIVATYPSPFGTVTLTFGSLLDQRWQAIEQKRVPLEGTDGQAVVTDEFISDGGVSTVRLGIARRFGSMLSVGVHGGRNLGDISRIFTRTFDSLDVEAAVPPYNTGGQWQYRGWTAGAGVGLNLGGVARVAGSWTWSSDLDANPTEQTAGAARTYSFPTELRVGGSALLAPGFTVAGNVARTGWNVADSDLSVGGAFNVWSWGGGLELKALDVLGKPAAWRAGYRSADLPFANEGEARGSESAFTGGLGLDLLTSGNVLLAQLDLALERGSRTLGLVSEDFWRLSTSVRVSGF